MCWEGQLARCSDMKVELQTEHLKKTIRFHAGCGRPEIWILEQGCTNG